MKKYEYEIRQIDAWRDMENGWMYNETWNLGTMKTGARNEHKAFTTWLKRHYGIAFRKNRTRIIYDGNIYEIVDRKTQEPIFCAIPKF